MRQSAFRIIWDSLKDVWLDLWSALVCNLVWLISVLLIIPGPPVTFALFYYANQSIHEEIINVADFFKAINRFWNTGWKWGFINIGVLVILAGDAYILNQQDLASWVLAVKRIYYTLIAFWILMQIFALPFLLEQEQPSVLVALRNSAVMIGRNPIFSITLLLLLSILMVLGVAAFMLTGALGGVYLAFVGNRAVINQLQIQNAH